MQREAQGYYEKHVSYIREKLRKIVLIGDESNTLVVYGHTPLRHAYDFIEKWHGKTKLPIMVDMIIPKHDPLSHELPKKPPEKYVHRLHMNEHSVVLIPFCKKETIETSHIVPLPYTFGLPK
jgi:hypothetical protein